MTENNAVPRRALVQGTAWAVPTVAFSAAAPAIAASKTTPCTPSIGFSGSLIYNWGVVGAQSTTQMMDLGGQTNIVGLPADVRVTSITYRFWIANRIGQSSPGQGTAFWMGNSTSDKKGTCTSTGCSASWTPTAGSGFAPTVTNTANLVTTTFLDGSSRQAWDFNMRWDASRDTNIASRYSTGTGSCQNFSTGPSSKFRITYSGVVGPTASGWGPPAAFVRLTATLSNGQILTKDLPTI